MIRIEGVAKRYGDARALGPVSLEVPARTTLALVGASGCGKSTLLRAVVGLVLPDEGRIEIGGVAMTPASAPGLRLRMGYVIQDGGLFPHLRARDNAAIVARHLGWRRERIEARLKELSALVRLSSEVLDRHPAQLSGGERQRVSLMRALFLDPDVILLDEPLGALDALVRAELQQELRGLFRALAKTAIFVTHDLDEAAVLADEVAVMNGGLVLGRGKLEELARDATDPFVRKLLALRRVERQAGDAS